MRDIRGTAALLVQSVCHPLDYGKRLTDYLKDELEKRRLLRVVLTDADSKFASEREFVRKAGVGAIPFPYPRCENEVSEVRVNTDERSALPYVLHRGKRLFFRAGTDSWRVAMMYRGFLDDEGITGQGKRRLSPHAYESASHRVESGDVLLDVGCPEAIFTLEHIDLISKAYLFEADPKWQNPLKLTFSSLRNRIPIEIVPKLVSGESSPASVRLSDVVSDETGRTYFLKMDIEGYEYDVLSSSVDFLRTHKVKVSCCTYHRQEDYDRICSLLGSIGYTTSCSSGYMLLTMNGIVAPYFRHGVLYARNY